MENKASDEDFIVRYLLGDLPEREELQVEDRAFSDSQYMQDILAVESDLIDEYVRGGLSERERRQFESRFTASHERRQKVEFARALSKVASEATATETVRRPAIAPTPVSWWASFIELLRGANPAVRFSLGAATLVVVIGVSLLIIQTIKLRSEIAQLQAKEQALREQQLILEQKAAGERGRSDDLANQLQREREQRERGEELARQLDQERDRLVRSQNEHAGPATIALLILSPGISRGAANRPVLAVPQAARLAQLQIGIEHGDEYKSFRVELATAQGRVVWTQENLRPRRSRAGRFVNLTVPASLLDKGEYELSLKGVTADEVVEQVAYYYFAVLKK